MQFAMQIAPMGPSRTELERSTAEFEPKAIQEPESEVKRLWQQAKLCREWIAALRSGMWTP